MLKRAVKVGPAEDESKKALEKHLFPSSSPTPTQNGTLDKHLKKAPSGASFNGSSTFVRPSKPAEALQPRSANVTQPTYSRPKPLHNYGGTGQPFASLYNKQDSFKDEPEVIDLADEDSSQTTRRTVTSVYINEDDFSDDENLDLDFEVPSALPPPPPPPVQKIADKSEAQEPRSNASVLSWSQSSPSHYHPPPQPSAPAPQADSPKATKRRSLEQDPVANARPAKKRQLPSKWQKSKQAQDEEDPMETYMQLSRLMTQSARSKTPTPWNATASDLKAKKKELKSQQRKPAVTDYSMDEIKQAAGSHASAQASAISLSNEQRHVKGLVCDKNQSVFFTGPAGTGKSVLMRAIIQDLKKKFARDPERLAVTASTGLAACNIGGMTLHSFSGIGLGKEDAQTLVKKIRRNPKAKNRWLRTKVLIIDEISMVDGDLFDKLSQIGRTIRNNGRPWGGIQLVITGDFFQLPPVPDGDKKRDIKFAFEAATWSTSIDHTIGLTEVFRQKDPVFAQMLNEMRLGQISDQTVSAFKALSRPLNFDDGLEFTELFPTRYEVDNSNQQRLRALPGKVYRYDAHDTGDPAIRDRLLQNMMAPKTLELKKGAQVMLIKNMDETLVNGSLGTVIGFMTESAFELNGIGNDEFLGADAEVDPNVKKRLAMFSRELDEKEHANQTEFPLVQFHAVDGTPRIILCNSEPWKVELPTGEVQAAREQIPLILAWALSIHKAQGQTLERVKVDLGKVFEKGQAYVALSRATSQQGLQVLRFDKSKVMAHPRVVQFYRQLYSAESAVNKKKGTSTLQGFLSGAASGSTAQKAREVVELDEDEERMMAAYG